METIGSKMLKTSLQEMAVIAAAAQENLGRLTTHYKSANTKEELMGQLKKIQCIAERLS